MDDAALYLEADEDITSAIDKLGKTAGKSVSIVVPKRSTMLQSVINLKLLKKAAAEQGKELVIVTSDKVATDLAARVGVAVAPALGAAAVMGAAAAPRPAAVEDIIEENDPLPPQPEEPKPTKAAKVAAPIVAAGSMFKHRDIDEKAKPDEPQPDVSSAALDSALAEGADGIKSKDKSKAAPKVPNFGKMTRRMTWLGGALAVIIGYFVLMAFFTTAKVTIYATANKVDVDTTFAVDPNLHETDLANSVLAGQTVTYSKDLTGSFTATGQQDAGTKATGTVTIKNCEDSNVYPLAAGNTLTSNGLNFVTVTAVSIPGGTFSGGGTNCTSPTVSVAIVAAQNGDNYNLTNASFTSAKLTANFHINAAQLSGGTSKMITIVTPEDVTKAQKAAIDADAANVQKSLDAQAPTGYVTLPSSLAQTATNVVSTPAVNQEGTSATIALKATYTELAVKKVDLTAVIMKAEQKQVGTTNQIYQNGIDTATISLSGKTTSGASSFHFTTEAFAGARLDTNQIAKDIKGKRYGDAQDYLGKLPGVVQSQITLWPAWASNLPSRVTKITITIQVAGTK